MGVSVQPERLFGRTVIYYDDVPITRENICTILNKAMPIHRVNMAQIEKLYTIFKGKQAIFDKVKDIRPEINNKIVINASALGLMDEAVQYFITNFVNTSENGVLSVPKDLAVANTDIGGVSLLKPDGSFKLIRRAETPADYFATFDMSEFKFGE